jgi:hypothetical protein
LFSVLLILALSACGGNEGDATAQVEAQADQALAENQLRLVCDDRCAERAQCGTTQDGLLVVFMKRDSPDVNNQDLAIHAGAIGSVVATQGSQVVEVATGNQFTTTFFNLLLSDNVTQAWVPEWCVGR